MKSTNFTQANWAAATDEYVAALEKNFCDDAKFEKLIEAAKALMTSNWHGDSKSFTIQIDDNSEGPGERALLVDDSDSD